MTAAPHRPALAPPTADARPRRALILAGGGVHLADIYAEVRKHLVNDAVGAAHRHQVFRVQIVGEAHRRKSIGDFERAPAFTHLCGREA